MDVRTRMGRFRTILWLQVVLAQARFGDREGARAVGGDAAAFGRKQGAAAVRLAWLSFGSICSIVSMRSRVLRGYFRYVSIAQEGK